MDKLREEFEAFFGKYDRAYEGPCWEAYQAASASREELEWVVNGFLEWHEGSPCPDGLFDRARAVLSKEQQ